MLQRSGGGAGFGTAGGSKNREEEQVANQVVETWNMLLYKASGPLRLRVSDEDLPYETRRGVGYIRLIGRKTTAAGVSMCGTTAPVEGHPYFNSI